MIKKIVLFCGRDCENKIGKIPEESQWFHATHSGIFKRQSGEKGLYMMFKSSEIMPLEVPPLSDFCSCGLSGLTFLGMVIVEVIMKRFRVKNHSRILR